MRIGEVAARASVHVETLRYYERRGLLREPKRQPSGYRSYGEDSVRLGRFIKRAQGLGVTLSGIEGLMRLAQGGAGTWRQGAGRPRGKVPEMGPPGSSRDSLR